MMRNILLVNLLLVLAACSSTTGPVNVRDTFPQAQPAISNNEQHDQQIAIVSPVTPERSKKTIPSVERLIRDANRQLANKDYQQSISSAERGLRIDRKESRLYLLLAQAYRELDNATQSAYFAKQGLRYASKSSATYRQLIQLAQ